MKFTVPHAIGTVAAGTTALLSERSLALPGLPTVPMSIATARERADRAGVADRVRFEVAAAKSYPGRYDFVTFFDCLHDMGDPVGAARHVRSSLAPDGTWMLVEPFAHNRVEDNLNPVGRLFYGASTLVCTQASLAQEVGLALGAPREERQPDDESPFDD